MSAFLVPFMGSSINLALPHIAKEFKMNSSAMGWVVAVYLLASAIFQVPFGRLADIIGKKRLYVSGLFIFAIASALCCFPVNGSMLIVYRTIQAIGSAMIFSTSISLLTDVFPLQYRGKVLGINTAVVYMAAATGPFLGGVLTDYLGWRSIFICVTIIALLAGIRSFKIIKETKKDDKKEPFDKLGAIIYGIALFAFIYGFTLLPKTLGYVFIVLGIIVFVMFVYYEKKRKYPVFNVGLFFSNRVFLFSSLAAFINYAATFGISFLLSIYLQYVKGFDARHAGIILISQPLVQAVFSPIAGRLSDKIEARYLASLGMAIISVILFALNFINAETNIGILIIMLLLLGLGFALFSSPNVNSIMSSVERQYYNMASATTGTMRLAGQAFSMGISMMVISIYLNNRPMSAQLNAEFIKSLHTAFLIFAILCAIGVYTSISRGKIKK
jgi:EmrB/QacA subfamily drug resistance transporter